MAHKRCQYCGRVFIVDRRVGKRQKACSKQCQKLRKKDNNLRFSKNNPGYWRGRYDQLKQWRQEHPEYQRLWRQGRRQQREVMPKAEIQAEMVGKVIDSFEKNLVLLREIQAEIIPKVFDIAATKTLSSFPVT